MDVSRDSLLISRFSVRFRVGNPPLCQYYQDPFEETLFYYGADERLRAVDRQRTKYDNDSLYATFFEEYRYDGLGRRILKRSRANSACTTSIYCKSAIERYVWDGDQILFEIRYPGWDTVSTSNLERDTTTLGADGRFYGRVAYTHAGGIDRPLGVIRIGYGDDFADGLGYAQFAPMAVTPHVSWEQIIDAASYETGAARRCLPPANSSGHFYRCVQNLWQVRSAQQRPDGNVQKRPLMWFGSLMQDKMDETGQLFMRNRYYDPVTGRFTQEDPLGLAGGVNLYGFARGDLVNYGDPFGLFPCCDIGMAFAWSAIQEEIESEEYAAYQKSLAASGPVTAVGVDVGVVSPVGGWVAGFGAYSSDAGGGYYVTVPDKDKAAPLGGSDPPSAGVDVITSDNLAAFSGPSEGGGGSYFYMNYTRFTNDNGKTQSFGLGVSTAAPWLPTGYFGDTRTYITPPGALDPPKLPFGLDWAFTP